MSRTKDGGGCIYRCDKKEGHQRFHEARPTPWTTVVWTEASAIEPVEEARFKLGRKAS